MGLGREKRGQKDMLESVCEEQGLVWLKDRFGLRWSAPTVGHAGELVLH